MADAPRQQIASKAEFYRLWKLGVLGNRPRTFETFADAYGSGCPLIGIREVGKAGGGRFDVVKRADLALTLDSWEREGRRYTMDGAVRNDLVTLQGEVCRTFRGLEGFMAVRSGTDIRAAMRAGLFKPVSGSTILDLLNTFMDPSSQDDLRDLLDLYPDATIEFACFPMDVGVIPNRNTLFWEVRNY